MKNIDVVDLFDEEIKKIQNKLDRKVEKMRLKEEKKKAREIRKFEKEEDQFFNEYMKKLRQEKLVEVPDVKHEFRNDHINISSIEKMLDDSKKEVPKKHHVSTLLIIILSICLLVLSSDYILYNATINYKNLKTLITSSILVATVFFYILSLMIKKDSVKRFFEVISLLSFICYIAYLLFIA